jgi:hypothetical protein
VTGATGTALQNPGEKQDGQEGEKRGDAHHETPIGGRCGTAQNRARALNLGLRWNFQPNDFLAFLVEAETPRCQFNGIRAPLEQLSARR